MILFAISVSQVKVITLEEDYRLVEGQDPRALTLQGFSKYYGGADTAIALARGYDAHFIPVKDYGCTHPRAGYCTPCTIGYQAVDESSGAAEAHEIVIQSHHQCIPIAIVYFKA